MSNMIVDVGPPLELGMFDKILARVTAVGTSPSLSTRSNVPVGKNGNISVNDATNIFGKEYTTEICSKIVAASWNDAKKATWRPRISSAFSMNMFGYPSGNLRHFIVPSSTQSVFQKSTPNERQNTQRNVGQQRLTRRRRTGAKDACPPRRGDETKTK